MTNFAACRSKRSVKTQLYLDTQSRILGHHSVLGNHQSTRLTSNGNNCGTSIYSGYSSSTLNTQPLSRASTHTAIEQQQQFQTVNRADCYCALNGRKLSTQASVISSSYLHTDKCGLCKQSIKSSREEFVCGHSYHFSCLWRYQKINPDYNPNQCPKNCFHKKMVRTKSIESNSSLRSSSSSSSTSSSRSNSSGSE